MIMLRLWKDSHDVLRRSQRVLRVAWGVAGVAVPCITGGMTPVHMPVTSAVFTPALAHGVRQDSNALQPTHGDGAPLVSLHIVDGALESVVREIARQAHMQLAYDKLRVSLSRRVTVRVKEMPVTDALERVLRGTGIVARITAGGETITLSPRAVEQGTQVASGVVVGRVTDSTTGAGLKGASIRVAGTKISAASADSGQFTLKSVPPGDQVLLVRLFGYRPAERTVTVMDNERTTVRITMAPVPTVLSGVVTTATGLQRKVEVGNDITSINVDSVMQVAPISSVTDLLETRVPGLTVLHSSGDPGNPSRIRIRGASSITGNNDPIVIVDGVRVYASQSDFRNQNLAPSKDFNTEGLQSYAAPSPLDQIDPNSIATIEVFKGPSASALYGSDAANGVIVITTKHGRAGPTHWDLALGDGVNWLPGNWPTNYYRFGSDAQGNLGPLCPWNDVSCRQDSLVAFQALNDPRYTVFAHGSDQTANLTVSGGVPTLQYSLTGSAAGDVGNLKLPGIEVRRFEQFYGPVPGWMLRPDNYQHWGVSGQLTTQPSPGTRVTLQSSLFNSHQQQGSLQQAISQIEGEYIDPTQLTNASLIQNDVERATDDQLTSTNALTFNWQPYPWLPLTATGGLNTIQRNDAAYIPYGVNACSEGGVSALGQNGCNSSGITDDTTGYYALGRGTSQDKTLTVGTSIPVRLLTLGIGANLTNQSTADVSASTNQLAPGVSTPTSFPTQNNASSFNQQTTAWSTYGWYAEPRFNVNSRFFVSPGFRLDGGSASGANAGLTGFPKIDFSYLAVDQSHALGILTLLRPRLAFGYAGTQPPPTEKLRLFNAYRGQVVSLDGSTFVPAVWVTTLGNTALRPERSRELEGGVDAAFWNGRMSLTYTRYDKTRTDAIISIPIAPSVNAVGAGSGVNQQYTNIGVVRNTGTELAFTAQLLESRALSWMVGGNLSNDNNLVVRLNPGQQTIVRGDQRIEAGYPLWGTWARPIVAFADANNNGIIDPTEIVYGDSAVFVGQADPKYQLNFNTGVTLLNGRLSVNATFAYQNGLTQTNAGALNSNAFALLPNTPGTSLETQAAVVAATCGSLSFGGTCFGSVTSIGVMQTVNTFRFNDLSINYDLPKTVSTLFRVPRMTLALQGSNLGLHTNYRGKDPNVNIFSTNFGSGDLTVDAGQVPQPRIWWLKLTLGN